MTCTMKVNVATTVVASARLFSGKTCFFDNCTIADVQFELGQIMDSQQVLGHIGVLYICMFPPTLYITLLSVFCMFMFMQLFLAMCCATRRLVGLLLPLMNQYKQLITYY